DAAIAAIASEELARFGVVLEQDLDDIVTYSVGRAQVGGLHIAYYGEQQLTRNHHGALVYGGSTLHVRRGDLTALPSAELPEELAAAILQAAAFDRAAEQYLPG